MELVATLCYNKVRARSILKEVSDKSIVLLPESVWMDTRTIDYYSAKKRLFVVFNQDCIRNGKHFITMIGKDCGREKWRVQKHYLWNDYDGYWHSGELNPIVQIRNITSAVCVCYELSKICGRGRLYNLGERLKQAKIRLLLLPSSWQFNFNIPKSVSTIALKKIPSLKAVVFSNRTELAFVQTQKERKKIIKSGWVSTTIE